jgi:hypothetical protein
MRWAILEFTHYTGDDAMFECYDAEDFAVVEAPSLADVIRRLERIEHCILTRLDDTDSPYGAVVTDARMANRYWKLSDATLSNTRCWWIFAETVLIVILTGCIMINNRDGSMCDVCGQSYAHEQDVAWLDVWVVSSDLDPKVNVGSQRTFKADSSYLAGVVGRRTQCRRAVGGRPGAVAWRIVSATFSGVWPPPPHSEPGQRPPHCPSLLRT